MNEPRSFGFRTATRRSVCSAFLTLASLISGACDDPTTGIVSTPRSDAFLTVSPTVLTLDDGATGLLTSSLTGPSGKPVAAMNLEWSSAQPGIASVSSTGLIEAKHPGETTVVVRAPDFDVESQAIVIVRPVADDVLFVVRDDLRLGTAGDPLPDSVEVRVIDRGGLPVPGVPVDFEVELGGGLVSPAVAVTDALGYAKAEWTLGSEVGSNALYLAESGAAAAGGGPKREKRRGRKIHAWADAGEPAQIVVDPPSDTLGVADTNHLTAQVLDRYGNLVNGAIVNWVSENSQVAAVDPSGNVQGLKEGDARITASTAVGINVGQAAGAPSSEVSASASIRVEAPEGMSMARVSGMGQTGSVGEELAQDLSVRVVNAQGVGQSGVLVSWAVSGGAGSLSESSVTTSSNGDASVRWTLGTKPGTQEVTAWAEGVSSTAVFSSTAEVGGAESITVTPADVSLETGDTEQFAASAYDAYGNKITNRPVTWESSAPFVVQVDVGGFATATGGGAAVVLATLDGATGSAEVSVAGDTNGGDGGGGGGGGGSPLTLSLNPPTSTTRALGAVVQLTATVTDGTGTFVPEAPITWTSLNPQVASVDNFGRVVTQTIGTALIVASTTGAADTVSIESDQVVSSVQLEPAAITLDPGESVLATASALDSLGSVVSAAQFEFITTDAEVAVLALTSRTDQRTIQANSAGEASVVARADGITDVLSVTVTGPPLVTLALLETTDDSVRIDVRWSPGSGRHRLDARQDSTGSEGVEYGFPSSDGRSRVFEGTVDGDRHAIWVPRKAEASWVGGRVRSEPTEESAGPWGYSAALEIPGMDSATPPPPPPPPPPPGVIPAFPGAQGYGATAQGGRGGAVYIVNRLDDSASNPQPGTLRHALLQSGPRTIVFAVAGRIKFNGALIMRRQHSDVTIAGQTAPGSGIEFDGHLQFRSVDNLVMRYVRMRSTRENSGQNNLTITGGDRIILDHVTAQFATDDNLEAWVQSGNDGAGPLTKLTLSRSLIGPGIGSHATAGGWRGYYQQGDHMLLSDVDYHHNLWVHNTHRTPHTRAAGAKVVNNVVYNVKHKAFESASSTTIDYVNNYLKNGPMGGLSSSTKYINHEPHDPGDANNPYPIASIYVSGNVGEPRWTDPNQDNWAMVHNTYTKQPLPSTHRRTQALPGATIPIQVQSATAAFNSVLSDVGANGRVSCRGDWEWNLDVLDASFIDDVRNGTGPSAPFSSLAAAGGLPPFNAGTQCQDSDSDGMPDQFETRFGLNPNSASDRNDDDDGDGFTNLEEYLNASSPR